MYLLPWLTTANSAEQRESIAAAVGDNCLAARPRLCPAAPALPWAGALRLAQCGLQSVAAASPASCVRLFCQGLAAPVRPYLETIPAASTSPAPAGEAAQSC